VRVLLHHWWRHMVQLILQSEAEQELLFAKGKKLSDAG
jgi:hypothetical protein